MPNSTHQLKHLLRVAFLALPLLLLLGLNGRTVTLRRPAAGARLGAAARGTVIRQRVVLEASAPLAHYVAPAALAWLPGFEPHTWLPRLRRRVRATAPLGAPAVFVAQLCGRRLLSAALSPQAP